MRMSTRAPRRKGALTSRGRRICAFTIGVVTRHRSTRTQKNKVDDAWSRPESSNECVASPGDTPTSTYSENAPAVGHSRTALVGALTSLEKRLTVYLKWIFGAGRASAATRAPAPCR